MKNWIDIDTEKVLKLLPFLRNIINESYDVNMKSNLLSKTFIDEDFIVIGEVNLSGGY